MRLRNITFAALALIAAGCTNDNEPGTGADLTGQPMRVSTEVLPQTRAGMDNDNLTTFYLRVTNGSTGATTNYDAFSTVTRSGDTWTYSPELTWQDGTTPISVSALCQNGESWTQTDYTTGKDIDLTAQGTEDGIMTADVLYMPPTVIDPATDLTADNAIPVTLSHLFAKLNITVRMSTADADNPITDLTIGGTQATATLTPEASTPLTLKGEAAPIDACPTGYTAGTAPATQATATYECILLPQTATFTVTANIDGTDYIYTGSSQQFVGNTQYNLTLEVDGIDFTMSVADEITVGGWGEEEDLGSGDMGEDLGGYTIAEDGTYQVYNVQGLTTWATAVQSDFSLNCTLMADIDLTGQTWPVIGTGYYNDYYTGIFDGQGHTISGLSGTHGFIGCNQGTIQNLTLLNPNLQSTGNIGGIVEINGADALITNCYVIGGSITSTSGKIGGIAYMNGDRARITNCHVMGGNITTSGNVGGIAFDNSGNARIDNCHVIGGSITSNSGNAGGIVSVSRQNNSLIYGCSSTANVSGGSNAGGIAGECRDASNITACYYAHGIVTGNPTGSIIGNNSSTEISACYWMGGAAQGIGNGTGETTEVTGDVTWASAAEAMNAALAEAGYTDYRWVVNTGDDADSRPLITEKATE